MKAKKLIELLKVGHGTINQEDNVREYIKKEIPHINQDEFGNLYLINENTPLLCAHMDNVGSAEAQKFLHKIKQKKNIIKGTHNMGADDKVGIYIAMELYRKLGDKISLLFTVNEERGGTGSQAFDKNLIATNTYCVIPDRYGGSDIISVDNDYCTVEFLDTIAPHLAKYGFKPAMGVRCDADQLQEYINCINISCGYFHHHSDNELVDRDMTCNTINALVDLIDQDIPRLVPPKLTYRGMYADRYDDFFYGDKTINTTTGGMLYDEDTGETFELPPGNYTLYEYDNGDELFDDRFF